MQCTQYIFPQTVIVINSTITCANREIIFIHEVFSLTLLRELLRGEGETSRKNVLVRCTLRHGRL